MNKPFIILDRDGVINFESDAYIKSPDEWIPIPGSLEAIAQLNRAGYHVIVITNQSGVARGYYDLDTLANIHEKLMRELAAVGGYVDEIFYCPHHPDEKCPCRKPQPGLFHELKKKYPIDFSKTYFVGDSFTDIQVAETVGCKPVLVLSGKGKKTRDQNPELSSVLCFEDLAETVHHILNHPAQ